MGYSPRRFPPKLKRSTIPNPPSPRVPRELLQELHTYLQHFDETGDLGASDCVAEIKSRLRTRILEVEAELRIGIKDHIYNRPR